MREIGRLIRVNREGKKSEKERETGEERKTEETCGEEREIERETCGGERG